MNRHNILTCTVAISVTGCTPPRDTSLSEPVQQESARSTVCKFVLFTGVGNLVVDVRGLADRLQDRYPDCTIDLRPWALPLQSVGNLANEDSNRTTARERAAELAAFVRANPTARIVIIGYSGGGGMAVFVVEALPPDVMIDRLVLIAPAISPDYPIADSVLPHVREFMVNYASERDVQVGLGTRTFGTMDREHVYSAGYGGFTCAHPKLVQVHWTESMIRTGHFGNHLGYLFPAWQEAYLMPALDPAMSASAIHEAIAK